MAEISRAQRVLELLIALVSQPYRYTRRDLEERFGVSDKSVERDLALIRVAGLDLQYDAAFRYAVLPERGGKELKRLLVLSEAERRALLAVLPKAFAKRDAEAVARKLESLYDFQRLGLRSLRSPELGKIDAVETAQRKEVCVRLQNYRSTSSGVASDRLIEAFHLDTANGIVQAYDLGSKGLRHFRLDRTDRVELIEDIPWSHQDKHRVEPTDAFRIAMARQVRVHLTLNVAAYNELIERFPQTRSYVEPGREADTYDFDAPVNTEFRGLLPFVMGHWAGVEIHAPEELRERCRGVAREILGDETPSPRN